MFSILKEAGFKRYFANTFWLFADKGFRLLAGLVVGVWVARYLGPEEFGLLNYSISLVGLFITFATLGLDGVVVRELVRNPANENRITGTSFWLKLGGALLVLLILVVATVLSDQPQTEKWLVLWIGASVLGQSFNVIDYEFQSKVQSKFVVKASIVALVVASALKIGFILYGVSLVYFAVVIFVESVVLAAGLVWFYLKQGGRLSVWKFDAEVAKSLLKDSWPLIISGIVITLYLKIDQVMIKEMLGNTEVGWYAAAVRLSEIWYFIPIVISNSLYPAIVGSKEKSTKLYYDRLQKLYSLMVLIAVAIALPITFTSHLIIELLYGHEYREAAMVLMIHIWSAVFIFLLHASGKWLINENLTRNAFYRNLSGAVLNIGLNLYLIPKMGIVGSAIATLISYGVAGFFYDFIDPKLRKSFYLKLNAFRLKNLTG